MAQVAVDLNKDGEFVTAELVSSSKGWATIRIEIDGETQIRKVRTSQIALDDEDEAPEEILEEMLTDDDDDLDEDGEPTKRGDVFPAGIRETYEKGKTLKGKSFIDCGDEVAAQLRDMSLEEVAVVASKVLGELTADGWLAVYTTDREAAGKSRLNPGMVRMNLGNRIRAELKRQAEEAGEYVFPSLGDEQAEQEEVLELVGHGAAPEVEAEKPHRGKRGAK